GHYWLELPASHEYLLVADASPRPRSARQVSACSARVDFQLGPLPAPRPSDAAIATWLKERAVPLARGTELDAAGARAISRLVGEATIVAVGEATHGSAEFAEERRRIFQALVREKGFAVYAGETSWADARLVDDYVVSGKGDARSALRALRSRKDEIEQKLELIEWMRAQNRERHALAKLHFAGFDPLSPRAVADLVAYLRRVDADAAATAERALAQLGRPDAEETFGSLPPAEQERMQSALRELSASLEARRARYAARSSQADWDYARRSLRVIARAALCAESYADRDTQMFDTLTELIEQYPPGTKFLLDAHNSHIAAEQHDLAYLGRLLREHWGPRYVAIGFTFGAGSLIAMDWRNGPASRDWKEFRLERAPLGTLDGDLGLAALPALLIDLRGAAGPVGDWLNSPQRQHSLGFRFVGESQSFETYAPARAFDALLYLDRVSAIRPFRDVP
ncbi:MAG TPA: erythromycin esterase family protein, partial [Polyangiaceae bacterium]|nr:erythromycin esterase family protein [Polyangiaceae bacterium]